MRKIIHPFAGEIISAVILISILAMFLNPTGLLMPESIEMMLPVALAITFFIYSSIFWKERSNDERENAHTLLAGRISFLVGSAILSIGIGVQSIRHEIDIWLIVSLAGMILTKIASRIVMQIKH